MRKYGPTHGRTGKPGPVDAHIGARVRARRRLLAMRQETLGKALGVSFQMVQQYERGAVRISAAQLYDMANALDCPVGFFFDYMPAAIAASKTAQGASRAKEAPIRARSPGQAGDAAIGARVLQHQRFAGSRAAVRDGHGPGRGIAQAGEVIRADPSRCQRAICVGFRVFSALCVRRLPASRFQQGPVTTLSQETQVIVP